MARVNDMRLEFDHVGIPCAEAHADEVFVEATRVWVTNPRHHPLSIEYLRYEADSPVRNAVRTQQHVAYRVPPGSLEQFLHAADQILLEPWEAQKGVVRVGFAVRDGLSVEYMEYMADPGQWFPHEQGHDIQPAAGDRA